MCGIFGIINNTKKEFDRNTFCVLGINNDSRGGDSCGISIDGTTEYGINKEKLFINFMHKSKLINETTECVYAIGHDRKASVGGTPTLEHAQPVVFKDDKGKTVYTVIHNGTIHNYLDLKDKYIPDVDCSNMTDSQIMATIFYNKGYDCLSEYIGGSVFFIIDEREGEPVYLAFKGASKRGGYSSYSNGYYLNSNEVLEERPFYFITKDNGFAFSSIPTYLNLYGNDIYTIKDNTLVKFVKGKAYVVKEYDRSKCCQSSSGYYNGRESKYNSFPPTNKNKYNEYYLDYYEDYLPEDEKSTDVTKGKFHIGDHYCCDIVYNTDSDIYYDRKSNLICHGKYLLNKYGFGPKNNGDKGIPQFFFGGVRLYDKECFDFIEKLQKKYNLTIECMLISYPNLIHFLSNEPFKLNNEKDGLFYICNDYFTHDKFSGEINKIFSMINYNVFEGNVTSKKKKTFAENFDCVMKRKAEFDFEKLSKIYLG